MSKPGQPQLVDFESVKEPEWAVLKLADGTVLKIKLEITGIFRMGNDPSTGVPVYAVQAINVIKLGQVPRELYASGAGNQGAYK